MVPRKAEEGVGLVWPSTDDNAARRRLGAAHVQSDHFKTAQRTLPPHLAETPRIVNVKVPQDDWSELGEMAV